MLIKIIVYKKKKVVQGVRFVFVFVDIIFEIELYIIYMLL